MGAKSGPKGRAFEERIAGRLREIYDPPELTEALAVAAREHRIKDHRELLKGSAVRRSDQGRGAQEPDIVISNCPCWIECQDAVSITPLVKHEQAEKDVLDTGSQLMPAMIAHRTGEKQIGVWMSLHHVAALSRMYEDGHVDLRSRVFDMAQPVRLDFEDFLLLLKDDLSWRRTA